MTERLALRLAIRGRVQGVGFRHALRQEALRLGLAGWVRNRADGSVEAVVAGEAPAVRSLEAWARTGPPAARVTGVAVEAAAHDGPGFELRPTL